MLIMTGVLAPALREFGHTLDELVRRCTSGSHVDSQVIVDEINPYFVTLIADISWLDKQFWRPAGEREIAAYLVAAASDESWTLLSVVFPPGATTPIHDHLTWGLVGVVQGVETEVRYERLDDGMRAGFARLRQAGIAENGPGAVSHIVPPDREIHQIRNQSDLPSCSIHLYGGNLEKMVRHQYDLESNTVTTHQPAYVPIEA